MSIPYLTTRLSVVRRQINSKKDGICRTLLCEIYFLNILQFLIICSARVFLNFLTKKEVISFKKILMETFDVGNKKDIDGKYCVIEEVLGVLK